MFITGMFTASTFAARSNTQSRRRGKIAARTAIILLAVTLAGCATKSVFTTGSINKPVSAMDARELQIASERYGQAYERNPKDPTIGMRYASMLRMAGRNDQALAVMRQVAIHNPTNRDVLAAYGKALAGAGHLQKALDAITRAQTPDRPDWELLSARGAVLDQLDRSAEARKSYRKALALEPNEPSVLSNLGMSYLLEGDLRTAETYMRSAVAAPGSDSRIRQNLALVVGLQGRFKEAEQIAATELSQAQARANVQYLRAMLSQPNSWAKLARNDAKNDS